MTVPIKADGRKEPLLLEAYKLDGTFLWQIDMGINIRSGSHYTSFIVYDFDGDGKCEIAFRTSEGTKICRQYDNNSRQRRGKRLQAAG